MTQIHPIKLGFITCYLLASGNQYILVDAGYPKKKPCCGNSYRKSKSIPAILN